MLTKNVSTKEECLLEVANLYKITDFCSSFMKGFSSLFVYHVHDDGHVAVSSAALKNMVDRVLVVMPVLEPGFVAERRDSFHNVLYEPILEFFKSFDSYFADCTGEEFDYEDCDFSELIIEWFFEANGVKDT